MLFGVQQENKLYDATRDGLLSGWERHREHIRNLRRGYIWLREISYTGYFFLWISKKIAKQQFLHPINKYAMDSMSELRNNERFARVELV